MGKRERFDVLEGRGNYIKLRTWMAVLGQSCVCDSDGEGGGGAGRVKWEMGAVVEPLSTGAVEVLPLSSATGFEH